MSVTMLQSNPCWPVTIFTMFLLVSCTSSVSYRQLETLSLAGQSAKLNCTVTAHVKGFSVSCMPDYFAFFVGGEGVFYFWKYQPDIFYKYMTVKLEDENNQKLTRKARKTCFICHISCLTCHMSHVTCRL